MNKEKNTGMTIQISSGEPDTFDKEGYENLFNGVKAYPIYGYGFTECNDKPDGDKSKYKGTIG